jgi:hypothetical protein
LRKAEKPFELSSTAVCSQRVGIDEYKPDPHVYENIGLGFYEDPDQRISQVQWHGVNEIDTLLFKMTNDKVIQQGHLHD